MAEAKNDVVNVSEGGMGMDKVQQVIEWIERVAGIQSGWIQSHTIVSAVVGLAALVVIAFVLEWLITTILKPIFNRIPILSGANLTDFLPKPIFYSALLVGVMLILRLFEVKPDTTSTICNFAISIVVLVWTQFFLRASKSLLRNMTSRSDGKSGFLQTESLPLFENLAVLIVFVISLYFLFVIWDVDMTAWLASAGIAGMAIGFAAKDTLANLFSGVFIMADKPYKVGDFVVLDSGERGQVSHIGLRTTRLFTTDNEEISVPNAVIGNSKLINETGGRSKRFRVRIPVGVAYGSDIDLVQNLLLQVAQESDLICDFPESVVRFRQFADSCLNFELLAWLETPQARGRAIHELNIAVYKLFAEKNIEIPFPQQDVYIKGSVENADNRNDK